LNPSEYVQRSRNKNKQRIVTLLKSVCQFCNYSQDPEHTLTCVSQVTGNPVTWGNVTKLSKEKADNLIKTENLTLACQNCLALVVHGSLTFKKKVKVRSSALEDMRQRMTTGLLDPMPELSPASEPTPVVEHVLNCLPVPAEVREKVKAVVRAHGPMTTQEHMDAYIDSLDLEDN